MEGGVVRFLELFTNVEKIDFTPGHHDADQRPVVCTETLQKKSVLTLFVLVW